MDQFNYLAVLISIILGLGITQLLSGFGRWIEHRASFRAYAPAICWAFVLLVIQVQCWWSMFGLREQADWTFLKFMAVLMQPIVLYLQAIVVLPGASSTTLDLATRFKKAGMRDPATAMAYRKTVLEQGGSVPAATLIQEFLGRPFNTDAIREELAQRAAPAAAAAR